MLYDGEDECVLSYCEKETRLNDICPYFTRYELGFPMAFLHPAVKEDRVLDPFCGSGTSLFAARLAGLYAVGIDSNPVAVVVARAKLANVSIADVVERAVSVLKGGETDLPVSEDPFWERCFSRETLVALTRLRAHFSHGIKDDADVFLAALVSGVLHGPGVSVRRRYLSNEMPASFAPERERLLEYWTHARLQPPNLDVLDLLEARTRHLLDLSPGPGKGRALVADSRVRATYGEEDFFDRVVTSPPYFGLNTFVSDQWLRMWLLGNPDEAGAQICQEDPGAYVRDLALVWRHCAAVCRSGAQMAIRFGLTSTYSHLDSRDLLLSSLLLADAGWHVESLKAVPPSKPFPAVPAVFCPPADRPVAEITLLAQLLV